MKLNFKELMENVGKGFSNHAPAILIGASVAGMITTTILAVKATPKAMEHIANKKKELNKEKLTAKETVEACWKDYAVPAGIGLASVAGAVTGAVFAEKEHKTAAGALTALTISEKTIDEYREAIKETVGKTKAADIDAKVTEKHVQDDIKSGKATYQTLEPGQMWFRDSFTGQKFVARPGDVEKAVAKANECAAYDMWVSVTDLFDEFQQVEIGDNLATPDMDDIGWGNKIDIRFSPANVWDSKGNLINIVNEIIYDQRPTTRERADCFR